jgi:hypothetical protein
VAPQFTVPDVVAAARYYGDVLGFENRGFFGDPPVDFNRSSRDRTWRKHLTWARSSR